MQYTYVTVYFTPEQARTSRHLLQLKTQGFFFTAHPPSYQYQVKSASYVGRQLFMWRRSRQAGGTVPSMVHTPRLRSQVQKIQDRLLEDQLMSWSLC